MKSKKKSDEKAQVIEIVVDTEDTMTEEETKAMGGRWYLDGGPGTFLIGLDITSQKAPKNNCFLY